MQDVEYESLRAVEDVHWWQATLRRLVLDELGPDARGRRLLDAGCGTGGMLDLLCRRGWGDGCAGVDLAGQAVRFCRERGLECVQPGRVEELPYADGEFDVVLCLDVLYHEWVNEDRALAEMSRVLRPDGVLLINVAAFGCLRGRHDLAVCGARRYKRSQLRLLLHFHNLDATLIQYWNAWLFMPLWIWRSWTRHGEVRAGHVRSELELPSPCLNRILTRLAWLDAKVCRCLRVPFGSSLLAVARKRGTGEKTGSGRAACFRK